MTESFNSIESIRVLYEISTVIQSDLDIEDKFRKALTKVRDIAGCRSVSLFIHDEETGKLQEAATVGSRVDLIESIDFDMGKGFSAWVAKQRKSVLIPNLKKARSDGFRSFLSTPLISKDKLIGVMNLGCEQENAFNEKHMEYLDVIASQFAHAIERSNYEHTLVEKNEALERAHHEIQEQQQKIVEMEKYQALGQMAVSINHEINNPLTTIMGNVELLLITNPDMNEIIRKKLNVIMAESKRISQIVERLRDMKKIVVGNYIERLDEKMIDLKSSGESDREE